MDDRFKKELDEKIYSTTKVEELDQQMSLLFNELFSRRRDDEEEEGLQAAGVIYPDGFAAKICERDGKGTHQNSFVNLTKYLNGDDNYLSEKGTGFFTLYKDIMKQLHDAIQVRIVAKEKELILSITGSKPITTSFQLESLKRMLAMSKQFSDSNSYESVKVGVSLPDYYFEHTDISDDMISGININRGGI